MRNYYRCLLRAIREGRHGVTATLVSANDPTCLGQRVYVEEGRPKWPPISDSLSHRMVQPVSDMAPQGQTLHELEGVGTLFIEPVRPGSRILVLGGGHVAQALSRILAILRYETIVVDDRQEFANETVFPYPTQVVCKPFIDYLKGFDFDTRTFIVIVTRGHSYDHSCLKAVIDKPSAYVGMIGSMQKISSIFGALEEAGVHPGRLAHVNAPIGLDNIRAQTPEEIAVSIAGRIITVNNEQSGERLDAGFLEKVVDLQEPAAIATIVRTGGSTPRLTGARMMITSSGRIMGSVGGGSAEAEILQAARNVIKSRQPENLRLALPLEMAKGEGMACGGDLEVFIEPLS